MNFTIFAFKLSIAAGLISLDNTALAQVMISQPLVACSLLGFLAGQLQAGLIMGTAFQLLYISDLPVGSYLPKDVSLVSMSALSAAMLYGFNEVVTKEVLSFSGMLFLAGAPLFSKAEYIVRKANNRFTTISRSFIDNERYTLGLMIAQGGMILFFLKGFLVVLFCSLIGRPLILMAVDGLSREIHQALVWVFALFPLIGGASILNKMRGVISFRPSGSKGHSTAIKCSGGT